MPPTPSPRVLAAGRWVAVRAGQWLAALTVGVVHLETLQFAAHTGVLALQLVAYAVPAAVTLAMRPASRRHAHRLLAPVALSYVAWPSYQIPLYLFAFAWVIRQCWMVERDPRDRHLRNPLRAVRDRLPGSAR